MVIRNTLARYCTVIWCCIYDIDQLVVLSSSEFFFFNYNHEKIDKGMFTGWMVNSNILGSYFVELYVNCYHIILFSDHVALYYEQGLRCAKHHRLDRHYWPPVSTCTIGIQAKHCSGSWCQCHNYWIRVRWKLVVTWRHKEPGGFSLTLCEIYGENFKLKHCTW